MLALIRRPVLLLIALALVASGLLALSLGDRSAAAPSGSTAVRMDHIPSPNQVVHYPTNAAKVFKWGREKWSDEFEVGGLRGDWVNSPQGRVKTQSGMLTLIASGRNDKVTTSPTSVKARYGRWEARVRIRETNHDGRQYRGYWELVPTDDFQCGAKSIVLASYKRGQRRATGAVRVPDKTQYGFSKRVALHNGWFHTYAVEITRTHISWFVDTKVIHTERRDGALSGIEYRPRFRLQGVEGKKHRTTWLQMDWVRHYDLSRPNAKSIKAPRMRKGVYKDPC
jgi:Glycosyl hydrolases family 16